MKHPTITLRLLTQTVSNLTIEDELIVFLLSIIVRMSKHQLWMERRGRQLQQRQQRDVAGNPSSTAASEPTRQHRLPDQLQRRAKDNHQMSTTISQTTTPHPPGLVPNSIQFGYRAFCNQFHRVFPIGASMICASSKSMIFLCKMQT